MRILVTNDDGILAEGLLVLKRALEPLGEVFVVAPERPRSGSGHSITLHKPLRLHTVRLGDGSLGYSTNGTPSDCVTLGATVVMNGRCDLVFSGINQGANLGWDVTYSGTVSAAMEGAIFNIPSVAISVCCGDDESPEYDAAFHFARKLVEMLREHRLPPHTLLNVNTPNRTIAQVKGVAITRQGTRQYVDRVEARVDPWGRKYYWLTGSLANEDVPPDSDVAAIRAGRISVTPIHLDLTAEALLEELKTWPLELGK